MLISRIILLVFFLGSLQSVELHTPHGELEHGSGGKCLDVGAQTRGMSIASRFVWDRRMHQQ